MRDGVYLVGLTGGIGSGKSAVATLFAAHGWPVIDADGVAREVVQPGEPALAELAERFGAAVLTPTGELDRPGLARLAFASQESREALEAITHPYIAARIRQRLAALAAQHPGPDPLVVVVDHPLIIETGQVDDYDAVVVVVADVETRLRRLVDQRGLDPDDARARMQLQTDDATRRSVATHLVVNEGTLEDLAAAAEEVVASIAADIEDVG